MRSIGKSITVAAIFLAVALPASATHAHRGPTSHLFVKKKLKPGYKPSSTTIAPQRATEIQAALIKAGYLTGEPTGTWDAPTSLALQKLQGDNGWQTKITPDARALIFLGLGPQNDGTETAAAEPAPTLGEADSSN